MSKKPDSIFFKFKFLSTDREDRNRQCLFELKNGFCVMAERSTYFSTTGRLKLLMTGSYGVISASTNDIPIFNGDYWNVLLKRTVSSDDLDTAQQYVLKVNSTFSNKINFNSSCYLYITGSYTSSYNNSYISGSEFYVGGVIPMSSISNSIYPLIGSVSSLKFYKVPLTDLVFENQSLAENTLISNNITSSFTDLATYLKFDDNIDLSLTSSIYDYNLSNVKNHGTASGFTSNTFVSRYQTDIMRVPNTLLNRVNSSKIFIDDSEPHTEIFKESSSVAKYGYNSNRVDFIFTPSNIENRNILKMFNLGGNELYSFIGDPEILVDEIDAYKDIHSLYKYYRNYFPVIGIQQYINNIYKFSKPLFKNIKQFIPERVDFNGGISIEPNILERTNVVLNNSARVENLTKSSSLGTVVPEINLEYKLKSFTIEHTEPSINSTYNLQSINIENNQPIIESSYSLKSLTIDSCKENLTGYDLYFGQGIPILRDDRIVVQGVKRRILRHRLYNEFYTGSYETCTQTVVNPISDFKYYLTYDTGSGLFYKRRNSAMEPRYSTNYSLIYDKNHIKYYIYNSIGNRRKFYGTTTRGPEHPYGANTCDGGKVIEITFKPLNKMTVSSKDQDTARLKVDGISTDFYN